MKQANRKSKIKNLFLSSAKRYKKFWIKSKSKVYKIVIDRKLKLIKASRKSKSVINNFINHLKGVWLWLSILIGGFFYLAIESELSTLYTTNLQSMRIITLGLIVIFLLLVNFVLKPIENLRKEKLWIQHSWVFYSYFTVLASPLVAFFLKYIFFDELCSKLNIQCYSLLTGSHFFVWDLIIRLLIVIIGIVLFVSIKGELPDIALRFAAGSVGLRDDLLGYAVSAKNWALGLAKLNDYVNVVYLYGDMGYGKSSLARMIVESFDRRKILYTYISLTETNQAKDFSLLFSERWLESLKERYPKISVLDDSLFLSSILRESGNGFLSELLSFISKFDKGLKPTKAKIYDQYIDKKREHTTDYIAQLFGNIPEFHETLWIVMIDEVERAKLEEIYRVIEVLERFKAEGRPGLPLKLVFILCISPHDLDELLNNANDENSEIKHQIRKFMTNDSKSALSRIFLPPLSYATRKGYLNKILGNFISTYKIKIPESLEKYNPDTFYNSRDKSNIPYNEALQFGLGLLIYEAPRTIQRNIQELELIYSSFRNIEGKTILGYIRFPDILIVTYASIRFPFLIVFFQKTINMFLLDQNDSFSISRYLDRDKYKKGEKNIFTWIADETGYEIPDKEKETISRIIGMIAHFYLNYVGDKEVSQNNIWRETSLSKPENLRDYLAIIASEPTDASRKAFQTYLFHQNNLNKNYLKNLSPLDLIEYSRFLWPTEDANILCKLELANEFCKRFASRKIPKVKYGIHDTIYEEAIYQFLFNLLAIHEAADAYQPTQDALTAYYRVIQLLKDFLLSPNVITGGKYLMLNSLLNTEKPGGGDVSFRLSKMYGKMKKEGNGLYDEVKFVVNEAYKKYFDGKLDIYDNEENFFYVLYQSWTGKKDDVEVIAKIQQAAMRNLSKHVPAIKLFWQLLYPYKGGLPTDIDELTKSFIINTSENAEFFLTLEQLVRATHNANLSNLEPELKERIDWWDQIANNPEELAKYKSWRKIIDKNDTLVGFLLRNGFFTKLSELEGN